MFLEKNGFLMILDDSRYSKIRIFMFLDKAVVFSMRGALKNKDPEYHFAT
jgi:hypothetical protein